jgi:AP-1 complex subunit sigma 1/2
MFNKAGKVRISKWYSTISQREKQSIQREVTRLILRRPNNHCQFVEWRDSKLVYTRYASLYFLFAADAGDNEIFILDLIQFFVEALDQFFGNACEIDIIFSFYYVYMLLDEMILGGEVFETSVKNPIDSLVNQHRFIEEAEGEKACEL